MLTVLLTIFTIVLFAVVLIFASDMKQWARNSESVWAYILWIPIHILWIFSVPFILILGTVGIVGTATAFRDWTKK